MSKRTKVSGASLRHAFWEIIWPRRGLIALGRLGVPEDIAAVTAFLCSADADFVSGVTIPVTGGQLGGM